MKMYANREGRDNAFCALSKNVNEFRFQEDLEIEDSDVLEEIVVDKYWLDKILENLDCTQVTLKICKKKKDKPKGLVIESVEGDGFLCEIKMPDDVSVLKGDENE